MVLFVDLFISDKTEQNFTFILEVTNILDTSDILAVLRYLDNVDTRKLKKAIKNNP